MKWSWKLGEIAGVGIYLHATFILLIGWVAVAHLMEGQGLADVLLGVGFLLALFVCVTLHELGHALAAQKFGIRTRDITLLPIGGVARMERIPDQPRQELAVALAGPAVNLAIAAALIVWIRATSSVQPLEELSVARGSMLYRLTAVNLFLALFNLLPAFPMDGGRVVRALLAMRMDYTKATHLAAALGQGMAFLFGLIGFFTNPFLMFIALFVWIGAAQEASMVQMSSALGGIPVSRAMLTDFHSLSLGDTLERAVNLILAGSQQDFPVLDNGRVLGILTRADLMVALAQKGAAVTVAEVMRRDFQTAEPNEMLDSAFQRLRECECHTVPVLHRDSVVGLLTADNVGEFLMIQAALGKARQLARA